MKHLPITLLIIIAALLVGIYLASERIEQLETSIHATEQVKRAHSEANKAEIAREQAARIDTIRDTIYRTRTRTEIVWRDRISISPPDSVVYVRLDSCILVGSIVLNELALCDSANTLKDSALASYAVAFAGIDSARVQEKKRADKIKRQRNWAICAAVAGWVAFLVK